VQNNKRVVVPELFDNEEHKEEDLAVGVNDVILAP
jgi:hypothetical protein